MGRPSKFSPERERTIVETVRMGGTRTAAAALVGISYHTLKQWTNRYVDFRTALEKAEAEAERMYTRVITQAAMDGTWQAAAWWLERRRHGEWRRRDEVKLTLEELVRKEAAAAGFTKEDEALAVAEAQRELRDALR